MLHSLAPLPFALPLMMAAMLMGLSRFVPRWLTDAIALVTGALVTVVCVILLMGSANQPIVYWFGGWTPHQGVALGVAFVVGPLGAGLASLAALLVTAALLFSVKYFEAVGAVYHVLMLSFLGAMCGFSLTGDLFDLFVFFELMSAVAFALTAYRTEEKGPLQGALNFAIINTVGAYLVLCGIALVYARTGALNFAQIGRALSAGPSDGLVTMAFVLIACGFLIKAAIVPFHFWLADAHAMAPTPVCVLFSGVMVELGVYGVARVYWTMFAGTFGPHVVAIRGILIGFGAATAILGAIFCVSEEHIKRLLAFSTISHVGVLITGLGLLTPLGLAGAAVYVLGHGLVKASLFLGAGILLNQFQTASETELFGRGRHLVVLGGMFLVGGLALAGLPPFGTALGKGMIEAAASKAGDAWLSAVIIVASALTGGAVLRVAGRVFLGLGQPEGQPDQAGADDEAEQPESARQLRTPMVMILPALVLLAGALASGLVPNIAMRTEQAAGAFINQRGYSQVVLNGAARLASNGPLIPTGPDLSEVAGGLGSTTAAVLVGLLAIYRRQLPAAVCRAASRHLEPPLQRLRGLQSGDVRDYAAWLTFGVATMGLAFAFAVH